MSLFLCMTTFEIWSLVFGGITAVSMVCTMLVTIIKFCAKQKRKVFADFELVKLTKSNEFTFITANLNIVNQTENPTSLLGVELVFDNVSVYATHMEHVIPNLVDQFKTKNIILNPFESISIDFAEFKCPTNDFRENAKLRIVTTQQNYTYPIFCRKREESVQ